MENMKMMNKGEHDQMHRISLQHFAPPNDRAEIYEIPENHAVDVLAKEITKQRDHITRCEKDINFLDDAKRPYNQMAKWVNQIKVHEKRIEECRKAIQWVYDQIID